MTETKQSEAKKPEPKLAARQSMTPEKAKELGLDPGPYGKSEKK